MYLLPGGWQYGIQNRAREWRGVSGAVGSRWGSEKHKEEVPHRDLWKQFEREDYTLEEYRDGISKWMVFSM